METKTTVNSRFAPHSLVAYKGGGYDGCFWEWNYAYIDTKGKFHNVLSTGFLGVESLEDLEEKDNDEIDVYDLHHPNDVADRESIRNVIGLALWFAQRPELDVCIRPVCDCCQKRFSPFEGFHPTDFHSEGGITYVPGGIVCLECTELYSCAYCHEFFGPEYEFDDENHCCEYCVKEGRQ